MPNLNHNSRCKAVRLFVGSHRFAVGLTVMVIVNHTNTAEYSSYTVGERERGRETGRERESRR